jgi:hypothetical protein
MSPGRPPPTEETNVSSDKVQHDGGGWELSARMPGDMVLHEQGGHAEEEDPGRSVRNPTYAMTFCYRSTDILCSSREPLTAGWP